MLKNWSNGVMEYWSVGLGTRNLFQSCSNSFTAAPRTNSSTAFERVIHKITTLQFEKPPHTAFAWSQHMAQNTLNSASRNHFSLDRPLSATSAFSHSEHQASGRAVSESSPQKNPTLAPESTAKARCLQTRPMPVRRAMCNSPFPLLPMVTRCDVSTVPMAGRLPPVRCRVRSSSRS